MFQPFLKWISVFILSIESLQSLPVNDSIVSKDGPLPIVMWHGINNHADSMKSLIRDVHYEDSSVYVFNVQIGKSLEEDKLFSVTMSAINQIDYVCRAIKNDPLLKDGYNAVGLSQGGLLIRGLAQRCREVPIKSLITLGAPSNGIFGVPDCEEATDSYLLCEFVRKVLNGAAYNPDMQDLVAPAQYWRDPFNYNAFLNGSKFLADLNNMREEKNQAYKDVITGLKNYVLAQWDDDTIIIPKESSLFGFYVEGNDNITEPLEATPQYKEDWLGLKTLNESGRLHFYHLTGGHTNVDHYWFRQEIVRKFLL